MQKKIKSPIDADAVNLRHRAEVPSFSIHIGSQGPPQDREDYQQWQSPYQTAVWIPGHNEWRDGQYVWVGGYYGYPPHRHSHWVAPRYPHNQDGYSYHPGHWSN